MDLENYSIEELNQLIFKSKTILKKKLMEKYKIKYDLSLVSAPPPPLISKKTILLISLASLATVGFFTYLMTKVNSNISKAINNFRDNTHVYSDDGRVFYMSDD